MTVTAFVLTRDRKVLLVECLRALLEQVDRVIVLDNRSTDGTRAALEREGLLEQVEYHRSEENEGGAGGYRRGIELALESGSDWIWLMDDDAEPRPDALEKLLAAPEATDETTVALCTAVEDAHGNVDPLHRCRYGRLITPLPTPYEGHPTVDCASFVGLLVKTAAARRAGLPMAEFFIGYDDAEWSLRLRRHGEIRLVPEARMIHKIAVGGTTPTRRSKFWNRVLSQSYASAPWESYWKDLYRIRNFMWIKTRHDRMGGAEFAVLTAVYIAKTLLYDERPLRRIPWLIRYARNGRRGYFGGLSPTDWPAVGRSRRRLAASHGAP